MQEEHNNLVIHTNELDNSHLNSVRKAIHWYSENVHHLHNIHLLQLKSRMPAHAMCLNAAEEIYREEIYEARTHLQNWKDLLGLPQCSTWIHEGSAKFELKSLCRQHNFKYLITSKEMAHKLMTHGYFWQRHSAQIINDYEDCVLISLTKSHSSAINHLDQALKYAVGY